MPVQPTPSATSPLAPLTLGVCSWSLQVKSVRELKGLLDRLGMNVVQIACGDPHHASWEEGDALPAVARESGIVMTRAMLGFPGEDYTTPQTIKEAGGFGKPSWRTERIERLKWALTVRWRSASGTCRCTRASFPSPETPSDPRCSIRWPKRENWRHQAGVILAFETGQETAARLLRTLDELQSPNIKVNFDPANMFLYDIGDPRFEVEMLGPDIRSVHVKDARHPDARHWGQEVRLGQGEVDIRKFISSLKNWAIRGPLVISTKSAIRPAASGTSPTGWHICENVSPSEAHSGGRGIPGHHKTFTADSNGEIPTRGELSWQGLPTLNHS